MTPVWPNREQWWVICATYAAVAFVQRDNISEPDTATAFLIVGALLVLLRLSRGPAVPAADPAVRRTVVAAVGVAAAIVIGAVILTGVQTYRDRAGTSYEAVAEQPEEAMPPVVTVPPAATAPPPATMQYVRPELKPQPPITPSDLIAEYHENDFQANEKYANRLIRVAASVVSVEGNGNEVPYLYITVGPRLPDMQAMFQKNGSQIRGLKKGDQVMLSCSPFYDADTDNIILNDCSIVK